MTSLFVICSCLSVGPFNKIVTADLPNQQKIVKKKIDKCSGLPSKKKNKESKFKNFFINLLLLFFSVFLCSNRMLILIWFKNENFAPLEQGYSSAISLKKI